ncbi:hypothetical protein DY000_02032601 [Brassica cretica]|uniref:Uncharacterized protein n=1 Tax=Brassica cretica TaxID=69181 RepID=A0ABQ7DM03_BRACR|nr:hypothetical protein DY000_02032601 [Brassica cretica]
MHGKHEVSLPPKPTNKRQLCVLATILANKTKLCGQPPKHPIEMRQELLGGGPVKEKHMSSCLKEHEVSLPPKPTNKRQLCVLATILANKTKLCGQPPKHPIEMRQELLGGGPVKEKHMSSCLKEVSKQLHLPEASGYA